MLNLYNRTNTPWPWRSDAVSVFSQIKSDPDWDVEPGTRFLMHHDPDAKNLDEKLIAEDILTWCRSDNEAYRSAALERAISKFAERIWGRHEISLLIAACDWTESERDRWCELSRCLLCDSPDFLVVWNSLEVLSACKAAVPTNLLNVLSNHKRLSYPCMDILLNLDLSPDERGDTCTAMISKLSGYRKLLCLRIMGKPVSLDVAQQILETPIIDIGQFGYPLSDNIDQYMEFLSYGRIVNYLKQTEPSENVLRNLIVTYAEIAECLFWDDTLESSELINAFPVFVSFLDRITLDPRDLYYLSRLHAEVSPESDETSAPYFSIREQCAGQIKSVLEHVHHRERSQSILKDPRHPDHANMIDVATEAYGANAFDLYFALAQEDPDKAFDSSYWLYEMSDDQRRRFLDWIYEQFPLEARNHPLSPPLNYSKRQKSALNKVLNHSSQILIEPNDRLTTLRLGLNSDDTLLSMNAAWLLEDVPHSDWPTNVKQVLGRLLEHINPTWTTWVHKERKYNKARERLQNLIDQIGSPPPQLAMQPPPKNEQD